MDHHGGPSRQLHHHAGGYKVVQGTSVDLEGLEAWNHTLQKIFGSAEHISLGDACRPHRMAATCGFPTGCPMSTSRGYAWVMPLTWAAQLCPWGIVAWSLGGPVLSKGPAGLGQEHVYPSGQASLDAVLSQRNIENAAGEPCKYISTRGSIPVEGVM